MYIQPMILSEPRAVATGFLLAPLLTKEGWPPLRRTGWFSLFKLSSLYRRGDISMSSIWMTGGRRSAQSAYAILLTANHLLFTVRRPARQPISFQHINNQPMKNLLLLIFALVAFTVSTAAQEPSGTTEPTLIKLPKAVNPKDGYPGGGPVAVRVTVNEKGEVTDAEFVSGPGPVCEAITRPDVLRTREAAVEIVRQAKFTPATSGGQPIPATTLVSIDLVSTAEQWEKAVGERSFSVTDFPPPPIGGSTPKNDVEKNPAPKENYEMRADSTT